MTKSSSRGEGEKIRGRIVPKKGEKARAQKKELPSERIERTLETGERYLSRWENQEAISDAIRDTRAAQARKKRVQPHRKSGLDSYADATRPRPIRTNPSFSSAHRIC